MKLAQALSTQKAIAEEIAHRRNMEREKSWRYTSYTTTPDAELAPVFDFEANHTRIKELSKLHTRLGQAISHSNLLLDVVGIEDRNYEDWV